jgi:hypothetical protein
MSRLAVAAVTLVASVLAMLGAAAWNRGGESAVVTLTERELEVWGDPARENAEFRLRLIYQRRAEPLDARTWLTESKLAELGFVLAIPANAPEAERTYGRGLPRLGFVALELDGPAWQAIARQRELGKEQRLGARDDSRLVPIDAGPDREALGARYRGQPVIVLPAVFRVRLSHPKEGAMLWGTLDRLVTEDVYGSLRLRERLRALPPGPRRYEADVAVGRLGVQRIVEIRPR